jgi:hypothetical protein
MGKKYFVIFTMAILSVLRVHAQKIEMVKSYKIPGKVVSYSYDTYQFVYLTDDNGNVYKMDSTGTQIQVFSPPRRSNTTTIEAYRNVNIFLFYPDYQVFYYLDRFLTPTQTLSFNSPDIGYVRLATPSQDNAIWLIDDQDFTLKKYNPNYQTIDINTPLELLIDPGSYEMNFIKEYQNLVFINDKMSGIMMFDNMGNYKTKIPVKDVSYVSFYKDFIIYVLNNQLHIVHIYTLKEQIYDLSVMLDSKVNTCITMNANQLTLLCNNNLYIFKHTFKFP